MQAATRRWGLNRGRVWHRAVGVLAAHLLAAGMWTLCLGGLGNWLGRVALFPVVTRLPAGAAALPPVAPAPPGATARLLIPRLQGHPDGSWAARSAQVVDEHLRPTGMGVELFAEAALLLAALHMVATAALSGVRRAWGAPGAGHGSSWVRDWLGCWSLSSPALLLLAAVPQTMWQAWLACGDLMRERAAGGNVSVWGMPLALGAWGVTPIWLGGALAYGTALLVLVRRGDPVKDAHACSACGYVIGMGVPICPECGVALDSAWRRARPRPRAAALAVCGVLALAGWFGPLTVAWGARLAGNRLAQAIGLY